VLAQEVDGELGGQRLGVELFSQAPVSDSARRESRARSTCSSRAWKRYRIPRLSRSAPASPAAPPTKPTFRRT
jgi:hypothetical protein